jgi:Ala-tRNA(Pro) deacylase
MENKVFQRLETYNIHQETFTHPAIFTVQQSEELAVSHPGAHTKNLFLKPKKADYFILVCIAAHKRLSLNSFGKTYGIKDITF